VVNFILNIVPHIFDNYPYNQILFSPCSRRKTVEGSTTGSWVFAL